MAGTLTISTLSDGTNSTSATNCISGSAKAWVVFNGTGSVSTNQTIRGSYNVAFVFKNGTGQYTVNFTNAMSNINYSVCTSARISGAASTSWNNQDVTNTTTAVTVASAVTNTGSVADSIYFSVAVFN